MTTYAHVMDGAVHRVGLPQVAVLADGRAVSGFDKLDPQTLSEEGWLPIVEDRPDFDPARSYLAGPEYNVETSRVVARYTRKPLPPALVSDRNSIPADGTTAALVTYRNYAADAPTSATFTANGASVTTALTDGVATVEVTAAQAGPVDVSVDALPGFILTLNAEEVPA